MFWSVCCVVMVCILWLSGGNLPCMGDHFHNGGCHFPRLFRQHVRHGAAISANRKPPALACLLFIHRLRVFLGNINLWWRVIDLPTECQGLSYYMATRTIVESRMVHYVEPVECGFHAGLTCGNHDAREISKRDLDSGHWTESVTPTLWRRIPCFDDLPIISDEWNVLNHFDAS